jgi:hypothetical protein
MMAGPIVTSLHVLKDRGSGFLPSRKRAPWNNSVFSGAKKLSTTALSQQNQGKIERAARIVLRHAGVAIRERVVDR